MLVTIDKRPPPGIHFFALPTLLSLRSRTPVTQDAPLRFALQQLALGASLSDAAAAAEVLERTGIVFLFAPTYHPAMRHVGPVRRELGTGTIMNLLGPLVNPAGVRRQVIGVGDGERAPLVAAALARL